MRVISGGQTGVDQAALRAARTAGLETGGTAPKGWRTLDGPAPWLAEYGLVQHPRFYTYPPRTEENIRSACLTLRIAKDWRSPGERLTARLAEQFMKPIVDVHPRTLDVFDMGAVIQYKQWAMARMTPHKFANWLFVSMADTLPVAVLNVAGNSERTSPGIGAWAEQFLAEVFREVVRLRFQNKNNPTPAEAEAGSEV